VKDDELDEIDRELYIIEIERRILKYQCKDFNMWHYWNNRLKEVDPYNPLLEVGFHGLPYFGGCKD